MFKEVQFMRWSHSNWIHRKYKDLYFVAVSKEVTCGQSTVSAELWFSYFKTAEEVLSLYQKAMISTLSNEKLLLPVFLGSLGLGCGALSFLFLGLFGGFRCSGSLRVLRLFGLLALCLLLWFLFPLFLLFHRW